MAATSSQATTGTVGRNASTRIRSVIIAVVTGAVVAVVLAAVWMVFMAIFSTFDARQSRPAVAIVGALVGGVVRWLHGAVGSSAAPKGTRTPLAHATGRIFIVGSVAAVAWLAATGLRPFGLESVAGWGVVGSFVVWISTAFTVERMFYRIPATDRVGGEVMYASINGLRALGFLFFTTIAAFPFYFMIASSLKTRAELLQNPTNLAVDFSQGLARVFVGYSEVMTRFNFGRYIFNSTFVALFTVIITLIPAILGAYAVTRLHFRGRDLLSRSILLIYMFPAIVLVIPLYSVFSQLGLRDTLPGLLVVYPAMTIPVALYMLRSYFLTLPKDIEEAGLIDGCTRFEVIWRITLPLSVPALASVGLYVFMIGWNEFLFAFMFLDTPEIFTLSRGVVSLNSQEVPRQFLMAGAVIITVPIMVLFFWFERFLVGGLSAGGVKG